jgi:3-deoxy-D-manno-octulosonic-acid transferase
VYFLYSMLTAAGMLLLAPYWAIKGARTGKYWHNFRERMGNLPPAVIETARAAAPGNAIWIHAVSVGEVLAVRPLAQKLKQRFPHRRLFISTTTDTGQKLARDRFDFADGVFYFPLDWNHAVRRAFRAIQPALIVVVETEIWPNFLREANRREVPVVFVNARISERSLRRFRVWRHVAGGFFERVLNDASVYLAQSHADADRLRELGAPEERVEVSGNLKYDAEPPVLGVFGEWLAAQVQAQERWPLVVAGSVVAEEEEAVLAGYDVVQRQWRRSLLILAPRKPDRFDAAAQITAQVGWKVVRRSAIDMSQTLSDDVDVLILDSIGELAGIYSFADAVFVGGSLVPSGGHNILEPAWFARPPVFGPSMENFRDMAQQFRTEGAGVQVRTADQLGKTWTQLIRDTPMRERMGARAQELARVNRGATERSLARIEQILASSTSAAEQRGPA